MEAADPTGARSAPDKAIMRAFRQRIARPPTAVVTVRIEDRSKTNAPAKVVGEQDTITKPSPLLLRSFQDWLLSQNWERRFYFRADRLRSIMISIAQNNPKLVCGGNDGK